MVFGWNLSNCKLNLKNDTKGWAYPDKKIDGSKYIWQKAICKLYEIQCSICNKYVTKKNEKLLGFSFLQKDTKTHYQFLQKDTKTHYCFLKKLRNGR